MALLSSQYEKLQKGMVAPEFGSLKGTDGKTYTLSDFKGKKALLVIFMCNHCPYVIPKFKYLVELQQRYVDKGLQIIGINCNDPVNYPTDNFESMQKIAKEENFNFVYLFDESQQSAKDYGAVCTPDPFLFNENMKLVYHGRFDNAHGKSHEEGNTSEMEDAIKQLLDGKEVTVEEVPSQGCSIKWK